MLYWWPVSVFTCQEKVGIDGYQHFHNPETMELQVLVKSGSEFKIHPDQCRQWSNTGGQVTQQLLGETKKQGSHLSARFANDKGRLFSEHLDRFLLSFEGPILSIPGLRSCRPIIRSITRQS